MSEAPWAACKICEEVKPVHHWNLTLCEPCQSDDKSPHDCKREAVCRDCARFDLQLAVFPTPLEEIPIQTIEDPDE